MTTESGHLASIAAVGLAAGFSIMLVYHAAPGQPAAVAPVVAPAADTEQPPYREGSAHLMTQSVLGRSSNAIDPSSYRPAPQPDPEVAVVAVPVPGLDDGPVPVAITGVGEGEPREGLVEPERIISGRPLVEQQVEASTRAVLERERIGRVLQREADRPLVPERREWRPDPVVRPIERREEHRVFAGGGARPILAQAPRRSFGGGGFGGSQGGARGGGRR